MALFLAHHSALDWLVSIEFYARNAQLSPKGEKAAELSRHAPDFQVLGVRPCVLLQGRCFR
jgi:hypothetical protein